MAVTTSAEDLSEALGEVIRSEFSKSGSSLDERGTRAVPAEGADGPVRLPRRIAGGFRSVAEDLDRRSRDWTNMVRLLEQQRLHLETAEGERDRFYETLGRIVPEVQESGRALKATIETTKGGDVSGDIAALFARNLRALDEMETLAEALNANLLWTRSAWEQYARSVIRAQKMREELKAGAHER